MTKGNKAVWLSKTLCLLLVSTALMSSKHAVCKEKLQTGDLLFVCLPLNYPAERNYPADDSSTDSLLFIHTAIAEADEKGQVWVIDATIKRGIDRHPLDTLFADFRLRDGSIPMLKVMRLKDNTRAKEYVENAKQYIGEPYDTHISMKAGTHYCTMLVYDSYVADGKHLFSLSPMDFTDGKGQTLPYWKKISSMLKHDVPQGRLGLLPRNLYEGKLLKEVDADF